MTTQLLPFLVLSTLIATPAFGQDWQSTFLVDHPLVGTIYNASGKEISRAELIEQLRQQSLILIGEKHDNPDHHQLEAELLGELVSSNTTVVFEMLDDSFQHRLQTIPQQINIEQLYTHLQWPETGWSWSDYGPLLLQVLQQGADIQSGNIGKAVIMDVYANGLDNRKEQERFKSIAEVQKQLQDPLTELVFSSHCGKVAREKLQPMVNIQLARDASMAHALTQSTKPKKILISGGLHTNKEFGVPKHMTEKTTTILLREVQQGVVSISEPLKGADYIWFTPQFSDEDYCDKFKK